MSSPSVKVLQKGKGHFIGSHKYHPVSREVENEVLKKLNLEGFQPISEFHAIFRSVGKCDCGEIVLVTASGMI